MAVWGGQDSSLESEDTGGAGRVVKGKKNARYKRPYYMQKTTCAVGTKREIHTHTLQINENGFLLLMDGGNETSLSLPFVIFTSELYKFWTYFKN